MPPVQRWSRVHPVAGPRVGDCVAVSAIPDIEAVEGVEGNRNPDAEEFQEKYQRKIRQKTDLAGIGCRPV